MTDSLIRLGISSCLLGQEVRYDGGHKRSALLAGPLAAFVEWVPVCPEVEAGLGVPRPAMRLVREGDVDRLREIDTGHDRTRALEKLTARRVRELGALGLCGYVFKSRSPSCGLERVDVHRSGARPRREGRGLFAAGLIRVHPHLPVEEEGRLEDPLLRENFIERVFAYRRLRDLFRARWTRGAVAEFCMRHELQVMAHSLAASRALGRLVASIADWPRAGFREQFEANFMGALALEATAGRNGKALQHAAELLQKRLDDRARRDLAEQIHGYRKGQTPRIVPVTLLRHHADRLEDSYLMAQTYLGPHPTEWMLRNHV